MLPARNAAVGKRNAARIEFLCTWTMDSGPKGLRGSLPWTAVRKYLPLREPFLGKEPAGFADTSVVTAITGRGTLRAARW
jgi:hypothetical protein